MVNAIVAVLAAALPGLAAPAGEVVYTVDAAQSSVLIRVGRSGLFSFAGHTHTVAARGLQGRVVAIESDLSRSAVRLSFETASLTVLEAGEPAGDAPKVQEAMLGPKVLDAARFPTITFESSAVAGTGAKLPLAVEVGPAGLKATGRLPLRQTDYGIAPVSVAGVVKVKDELAIEYTIVATPAHP